MNLAFHTFFSSFVLFLADSCLLCDLTTLTFDRTCDDNVLPTEMTTLAFFFLIIFSWLVKLRFSH